LKRKPKPSLRAAFPEKETTQKTNFKTRCNVLFSGRGFLRSAAKGLLCISDNFGEEHYTILNSRFDHIHFRDRIFKLHKWLTAFLNFPFSA